MVIARFVTCLYIHHQVEAAAGRSGLTRAKEAVLSDFNALALHIRFESDS